MEKVELKIVNGRKCILKKLIWKDILLELEATSKIIRAQKKSDVLLDHLLDFIFITILDKDSNAKKEDFLLDLDFY